MTQGSSAARGWLLAGAAAMASLATPPRLARAQIPASPAAAPSPPAAPDTPGPAALLGEVVLEGGAPLEGVTVFALDRKSRRVLASGRTDAHGRVTLATAGQQGLVVGTVAARFEPARAETPAPDRIRLTLRPLPEPLRLLAPGAPLPEGAAPITTVAPPRQDPAVGVPLGILRAAVVDEGGAGLRGVRVSAYDESTRVLAGTTETDAAGHSLLVLPPGRYRLQAAAAGLKPVRQQVARGRPALVMAIDAQVESVQIVEGPHVLRFRLGDSIDPEYYPPAPARAWLQQQYCLDVDRMFRRATNVRRLPGPSPARRPRGERSPFDNERPRADPREVPLSYAARQLGLTPYWWLKKLYSRPPGVCHHQRRLVRPLVPW